MKSRTQTQLSMVALHRLSGPAIRSQVEAANSRVGLTTAQYIVDAKIRNCRSLLTNYRQSRTRSESSHAMLLFHAQSILAELRQQVKATQSPRELFLLEARAARVYWEAVKTLCNQSPDWHRVHPQAQDALNRFLNVGYTLLARSCRKALLAANLLPQFGFLHGGNSEQPLVYDFMEPFRQPVVDAIIIPAFSRKQSKVRRLPRSQASQVFEELYGQYHHKVLYNGKYESLQRIIEREAIRLRRCLLAGIPWKPYRYPWRHGKSCIIKQ